MEFVPDLPQNLPPIYKEAAETLLKNVGNASKIEEKRKLSKDFARKFTVIPVLLEYWENLEFKDVRTDIRFFVRKRAEFRRSGFKHFYWEDELMIKIAVHHDKRPFFPSFRKTLNFQSFQYIELMLNHLYKHYISSLKTLKAALTFPHSNLEKAAKLYQRFSPLEGKDLVKFNESLLLYQKIENVKEENLQEWVGCLKESKDSEFVIHNFENRLAKTPCNFDLWKLYLEYLNSTGDMSILNVYSRFCRIFIEDKQSLQDYRATISKFCKSGNEVSKWIADTVRYEMDFGTLEEGNAILEKYLSSATVYSKRFIKFCGNFGKSEKIEAKIKEYSARTKPKIRTKKGGEFDFDPIFVDFSFFDFTETQNFPFPSPMMAYAIENASFIVYNKFIKCCKFFKVRKNQTLIWSLYLIDAYVEEVTTAEFYKETLFTSPTHSLIESMTKIWIGPTFKLTRALENNALSILLPKLKTQDIRYLEISGIFLTFDEFKYLTGSKKIVEANLWAVTAFKAKDKMIPMEDVLDQFPNAYAFRLYSGGYHCQKDVTAETVINLSNLKRNVKLQSFFTYFNYLFNPINFCEFIKKNAAPNATWRLYFLETPLLGIFDNDYRTFIKTTINNCLSSWSPAEEKPVIEFEAGF